MSITLDGNNANTVGVINSKTAQNATGTAVDFTGIPAGTKRITVMYNGVSTNGISNIQVQIGAGTVESTGYLSTSNRLTTAPQGQNSITGFLVTGYLSSTNVTDGCINIVNVSGNTWIMTGVTGDGVNNTVNVGGGSKSLSGTLDRVRITTVNGTDAFDAGLINILYE